MLTQEKVKELFDYSDENILVWKSRDPITSHIKTWNTKNAGRPAGSRRTDGYVRIKIDGQFYLRHRLVFLWNHGFLPEKVDHKDNIPGNDWVDNLRPASHAENMRNSKLPKNNTSGYKNVIKLDDGKFVVTIGKNRKYYNWGPFSTVEEAHLVAIEKRKELHEDFARDS